MPALSRPLRGRGLGSSESDDVRAFARRLRGRAPSGNNQPASFNFAFASLSMRLPGMNNRDKGRGDAEAHGGGVVGGGGGGAGGGESAAVETVDDLRDGSYGKQALKRRFNDLDVGRKGYVTQQEISAALHKLQLPSSDESVRNFLHSVTNGRATGPSAVLTFRDFANFALQRERELLTAFNQLDTSGVGFLTDSQLRRALHRMGHRHVTNKDVSSMIARIKTGQGAFSKGKGMLGASNEAFVSVGRAVDFAEFRDFLMLSTAADVKGAMDVWGRAVVDVGDVPMSFPAVSQRQAEAKGAGAGVLQHLLVGAVSGGVSRSVVAPLERVKIEYMIDSRKVAAEGGMLGTLRRIVRTEGAKGLFRGNALNVCRIAPTKAVEFFCYDKFKEWKLANRPNIDSPNGLGKGVAGEKQQQQQQQQKSATELDGGERMLGGSLASMAGTALTHPVDTLRSRVTSSGMSLKEAWSGLVAREGVGALWKGLGANMIRVAPYGAINFFVYDWCKITYRRYLGPDKKMTATPTLLFGALAGATAQTAVYPLEMVQRRIQVQGMRAAGSVVYKNMFHGIMVVARTEGFWALYAGLIPNYAKILPAAAVSFYVYEYMKEMYGIA